MRWGCAGSRSTLRRRLETCVSAARSSPTNGVCQRCSMIAARVKTRPGSDASSCSSSNSDVVSRTSAPSTTTSRACRSISMPPTDEARAAALGEVQTAAAQQRAHAAGELGERERLGDVVVGARLEADDDVGLGVARGQQDDRQRARRRGSPGRRRGRSCPASSRRGSRGRTRRARPRAAPRRRRRRRARRSRRARARTTRCGAGCARRPRAGCGRSRRSPPRARAATRAGAGGRRQRHGDRRPLARRVEVGADRPAHRGSRTRAPSPGPSPKPPA